MSLLPLPLAAPASVAGLMTADFNSGRDAASSWADAGQHAFTGEDDDAGDEGGLAGASTGEASGPGVFMLYTSEILLTTPCTCRLSGASVSEGCLLL